MNRVLLPVLFSLLTLVLAACSRSGPSKDHLRDALATALPAYLTIAAFDLEASENVGTEVEPLYRGRFRANIEFRVDTFSRTNVEQAVVFLRKVRSAGDEIQLFGKTQSGLYAGAWKSSVTLEGVDMSALGEPRTSFSAARTIILGTSEESDYRKEQALALEATSRSIAGEWKGDMSQPGHPPFPVSVSLLPFAAGESCGAFEHASMKCGGSYRCIELRENLYVVDQVVESGRDRCLGGQNHFQLQPDSTLLRIWFNPQTNREGARGVLARSGS